MDVKAKGTQGMFEDRTRKENTEREREQQALKIIYRALKGGRHHGSGLSGVAVLNVYNCSSLRKPTPRDVPVNKCLNVLPGKLLGFKEGEKEG